MQLSERYITDRFLPDKAIDLIDEAAASARLRSMDAPDKAKQLLEEIWGYDTDSDDTTVKTHISRIRNRFVDWQEFTIVTIRGLGYRLEKQ